MGIASVVAIPLAYWLSTQWLQDFAYTVDPSPWPFLVVILAALKIAVPTLAIQALRVARASPVEALRAKWSGADFFSLEGALF